MDCNCGLVQAHEEAEAGMADRGGYSAKGLGTSPTAGGEGHIVDLMRYIGGSLTDKGATMNRLITSAVTSAVIAIIAAVVVVMAMRPNALADNPVIASSGGGAGSSR